jgi:hypothetical protein
MYGVSLCASACILVATEEVPELGGITVTPPDTNNKWTTTCCRHDMFYAALLPSHLARCVTRNTSGYTLCNIKSESIVPLDVLIALLTRVRLISFVKDCTVAIM